jgi:hypothetical protein
LKSSIGPIELDHLADGAAAADFLALRHALAGKERVAF